MFFSQRIIDAYERGKSDSLKFSLSKRRSVCEDYIISGVSLKTLGEKGEVEDYAVKTLHAYLNVAGKKGDTQVLEYTNNMYGFDSQQIGDKSAEISFAFSARWSTRY